MNRIVEIELQELKELANGCKVYLGYSFITGALKIGWWINDPFVKFYKVVDNSGKSLAIISGYKSGENSFYICELGKLDEIDYPVTKIVLELLKDSYVKIYFQAADEKLLDYYLSLGAETYKDMLVYE